MAEVIRNLYKAAGLFSCRHPAHKQFGYQVSPYHIFCVKKCYPAGCVEFQWRCRAFEKGQACPRGFKHVGRGCFSCKKYHENKLTYSPETDLTSDELAEFIDDLKQYQGWLEGLDGKLIDFAGTVDTVAPHLEMAIEGNRSSVYMDGFYASFTDGFIGKEHFDDRLYLKISGNYFERSNLSGGDHIELKAYFTESRGRIILLKPKSIELTKNGGQPDLNISRALVGRATGKIITGPIESCQRCSFVSLLDIEDNSRKETALYRRFYCLRGVQDSENCPVRLEKLISR
jgi:hypothetical protein